MKEKVNSRSAKRPPGSKQSETFRSGVLRIALFLAPPLLQARLFLALGGLLGLVGAVVTVIAMSWFDTPQKYEVWVGVSVMGVASLFGLLSLRIALTQKAETPDRLAESDEFGFASKTKYLNCQLGVGFALMVLGVVCMMVFAGLAKTDKLDQAIGGTEILGDAADSTVNILQSEKQTTSGQKNLRTHEKTGASIAAIASLRVVLALMMSILGALFFVGNALRKHMHRNTPFAYSLFWAGLWYRVGEAILLCLAAILVFHATAQEGISAQHHRDTVRVCDVWLPLIALMLGMFIKSGEQLIFGLAERIFAATAVLLPNIDRASGSEVSADERPRPTVDGRRNAVTRTVQMQRRGGLAVGHASQDLKFRPWDSPASPAHSPDARESTVVADGGMLQRDISSGCANWSE